MAKYSIEDSTLTGIANAIREKEGTTDVIPVADFAARIAAIEGSGGGKKLSELTEGSLISVLEDGKLVPFYVAKHNYEADLNGEGRTLLVRKECYQEARAVNAAGTNAYNNGSLDVWLNGDYKDSLSAIVKAGASLTTFKHTAGNGDTALGTLSKAVFILSMSEFGLTGGSMNTDGTVLPIASAIKLAYIDGTAAQQWTRTPTNNTTANFYVITTTGEYDGAAATTQKAFRPCFTLPANMALNEIPYGDGSWGLADEEVTIDTETATTAAKAGVAYTNGIADLTPAQLHEIAAAISANPKIDKYMGTIYYDKGDVHRKISTGDTMNTVVDSKSMAVNIIGFNHDDLSSGSVYGNPTATGKAGMTFQLVDIRETLQMNATQTNAGGWTSCNMRTTFMPYYYNALPAELQSVIKGVNKLTSAGNKSTAINTTQDQLFLLSEIEVQGSLTYAVAGEGEQYAYYKAGNSKIKKMDGDPKVWWVRSPQTNTNSSFAVTHSSGVASANGANNYYGVSFAYCI